MVHLALGIIAGAGARLDPGGAVVTMLLVGWVAMPTLLALSLHRPALRYLLVIPATLVGMALAIVCVTALPSETVPRVGWVLITAGVWLGAALGMWLWYRWMPVPGRLDAPFSPARWGLIALHAGLITVGLVLVLI